MRARDGSSSHTSSSSRICAYATSLLVQTSYPPLVSASTSLAWRVTGDHSLRLGVVIIALLNTCALGVAAFALGHACRHFTHRLVSMDQEAVARSCRAAGTPS